MVRDRHNSMILKKTRRNGWWDEDRMRRGRRAKKKAGGRSANLPVAEGADRIARSRDRTAQLKRTGEKVWMAAELTGDPW